VTYSPLGDLFTQQQIFSFFAALLRKDERLWLIKLVIPKRITFDIEEKKEIKFDLSTRDLGPSGLLFNRFLPLSPLSNPKNRGHQKCNELSRWTSEEVR
jgi:hypothetical protein